MRGLGHRRGDHVRLGERIGLLCRGVPDGHCDDGHCGGQRAGHQTSALIEANRRSACLICVVDWRAPECFGRAFFCRSY